MAQVRERLRKCEALLMCGAENGEQDPRDRVPVALRDTDSRDRRLESRLVMRDELVHAAGEIVEGIPMRGQDALHGQITQLGKRDHEVTERIVA